MFFDRFKELCAEKKVSVSRAAMDIGLSNSTPTKWKNTGATPDSATLAKISSYFSVSVDYLLGNVNDPFFHLDNERILREINSYGDEDEKKPTAESGERSRSRLRSVARLEDSQITPEQDQQIADYIDFLLSKKKDS